MSLHDPDYILSITESWRESSRKNFEQHQSLTPVVMIFATRHPETEVELEEPMTLIVIPESMSGMSEQHAYASKIRELVKKTHAVGLFGMFESWSVFCKESIAEVMPWFGNLNVHPERIEIVQAMLYHNKLGNKNWRSFIVRDKSGKGVMTPYIAGPRGNVVFPMLGDLFDAHTYATTAQPQ